MKPWITSQTGVLTVTIAFALGSGLAVFLAVAAQGLSIRTAAASLLILCFVVFTIGGMLFTGRAFLKWQIDETSSYLAWERGFVIGGVLSTVLGLALLEDLLRTAGEPILSRLGMIAYLVGAVVVVVAETAYLGKRDWNAPQIGLYVVLAFLAQTAFGVSLLQTGLVAGWAGWATLFWNVGWLLVMLIVRPHDIYYPVLHHVAPLLIGIALLIQP